MGVIYRQAWWLIVVLLGAAAIALGSRIPDLNVDAGTNVLLNQDDPDLAYYNLTRPDWGYDEYAIFCVTRDDWFTDEGVLLLQQIVADLKTVEHVEGTTSVLDIPLLRNSRRKQNPLFPRIRNLGGRGCNLTLARIELTEHHLAVGNLISWDGRSMAILVHLDVPEETRRLDPLWSRAQGEKNEARIEELRPKVLAANAELKARRTVMVQGIREVAKRWGPKLKEPVRLAGVPVININLVEHVTYDLQVFGIAAVALFTLAFLIFYRRLRWVILPILTCFLPTMVMVGSMVMLGRKMTVITSNMPVLLFVLMLPYTVYFIERYRERRALKPDEPGLDSTVEAARAIFVPCLFSCLTTMAGFASLMTSGINPVRTFGTMMTIGMAVGLAGVFLFLPSLNRPLPAMKVSNAGTRAGTSGLVRAFEQMALRAPKPVLVLGALILGLSIWGALRLNAETKFTEYFWPDSEVYEGLEYIDKRMGGTTSLEIILKSKEEGFFATDKGMEAMAAAASYFDTIPEVGNLQSLKTLTAEVRKSFGDGIKGRTLVALLSSFAGPIVSDTVTRDLTTARIFVRFRETAPTLHRNRILAGLRAHLKSQRALEGLEVRETGVFLLYANMLNSLIESQKKTFGMVVLAIFLMLIFLFRSPVLAIVVLIPQVLPAVFILGVMGWTGVPLDLVTVMIASIAMGVGIDSSIQYTVRYRAELAVDGDRRQAVTRTHATIGRAIWISTTVIVAGFCVLVLSRFVPSVYFGLFTALAMVMGQFGALTALPALFLVTGYPRRA